MKEAAHFAPLEDATHLQVAALVSLEPRENAPQLPRHENSTLAATPPLNHTAHAQSYLDLRNADLNNLWPDRNGRG